MINEEQRNEKGNTEYKILNSEFPILNIEVKAEYRTACSLQLAAVHY
jgi:hypothetical protein